MRAQEKQNEGIECVKYWVSIANNADLSSVQRVKAMQNK